ncbi:MAG: pyridoxamine 5'-phosphate oxidase family protein [Candidatus Nanopelagicales bacterium]
MGHPVTSRPGGTERTRGRRLADRAVTDVPSLHAVLDAGLVAHVGLVDDGQPFVLPMGYARVGEELILHGSTGSRLMRALAAGAPACVTVTLLDGMVLARSAFESSMNYRSAMVLGAARRLRGEEELAALRALSDHLLPGRWDDIRPPSAKERAATMTVAIPLSECSVKIRTGGPDDDPADLVDPRYAGTWAGEVPLGSLFGTPLPEPASAATPVPGYVGRWGRS